MEGVPFASLQGLMYIQGMRALARSLLFLTILPMVGPLVPVMACGRAEADGMPCCKPLASCELGIGTGGCCRIIPAPSSTAPSKAVMGPAGDGHLALAHGRSPLAAKATPHAFVALRFDRLWYPPSHDDSAPLFLRNASILR